MALCAALVVTAASFAAFADPEPRAVEIGHPAPDFSVQNRDRVWQSWTDFMGERGLVFVFTTADTVDKLGEIVVLESELSESGLPILLIDLTCGQGPDEAGAGYRNRAADLAVRFDPKGSVASLYNVPGAPYVIAVDSDLILRIMSGVGSNTADSAALVRALRVLAQGESPPVTDFPVTGSARYLPDCGRDMP